MQWCKNCGQPTEVVTRDFGYGSLEVGNDRFFHSDQREVSKCCEAEVLERYPAYPAECIHQAGSLCAACWEEFQEDPTAWSEYGNHEAGIIARKEML